MLDGDSPPLPKGAHPQFSAHFIVAKRLDESRCHLAGLGPGHIVLDGDPARRPPPKKRGSTQPPIFGPCLMSPNGWMDQDHSWHGGRPRPRRHLPDGDPKGAQPPIFGPCLLWPINGYMHQDTTWYGRIGLSLGDIV